ncbi:MAG: hypothetical protein HY228_02635 [Candidatus Yonathbacteria bacterium]|nr:hypothetical protein [Candidatus Yonathbacteria bacterium]
MQDYKQNRKNREKASNILLTVSFLLIFVLFLGIILERELSITAKVSTVMEGLGRGAKVLLLEKKEIPIVYAQWGSDSPCHHATLRGEIIPCEQALAGDYVTEWVPYPSQKIER